MFTFALDGENDATWDLGLDCVYAHALHSADDAAIELGFGTTTFKKRCEDARGATARLARRYRDETRAIDVAASGRRLTMMNAN